MLRQEFVDELVLTRSLRDECKAVFVEQAELGALADAERRCDLDPASAEFADALEDYNTKMALAEKKGAFKLDAKVDRMLGNMGFAEAESDAAVSTFSGGWKMRIGLAKLLLNEPDVLLLDEPTNHMDIESVEWLENFLRAQAIPMVIVSHDREFLDQVANKIVDMEQGVATKYDGGYRATSSSRRRGSTRGRAYAAQEKKLAEDRAWVNRFKSKNPAGAKSREKAIERTMKSPTTCRSRRARASRSSSRSRPRRAAATRSSRCATSRTVPRRRRVGRPAPARHRPDGRARRQDRVPRAERRGQVDAHAARARAREAVGRRQRRAARRTSSPTTSSRTRRTRSTSTRRCSRRCRRPRRTARRTTRSARCSASSSSRATRSRRRSAR